MQNTHEIMQRKSMKEHEETPINHYTESGDNDKTNCSAFKSYHTILASEWNDDKNKSIDWTSYDDVKANGFTFLQILDAHSRLKEYMNVHIDERQHYKQVFASCDCAAEQESALAEWNRKHLLTLRSERWCRRCGAQGHTSHSHNLHNTLDSFTSPVEESVSVDHSSNDARKTMTSSSMTLHDSSCDSAAKSTLSVLDKHIAHQQRLQRLNALKEQHSSRAYHQHHESEPRRESVWRARKTSQRRQEQNEIHSTSDSAHKSINTMSSSNNIKASSINNSHSTHALSSSVSSSVSSPSATRNKELNLFTEERRRGVISKLDRVVGIGFVQAIDFGEVKFFIDRADFGVKEMALGESVTLRIDYSREFPLGMDVRPERQFITITDVECFINKCALSREPIRLMTMLLTHGQEWYELLRHMLQLPFTPVVNNNSALGTAVVATSPEKSHVSFLHALHTLVEMMTFIGNREPIHLDILAAFLHLTISPMPQLQWGHSSSQTIHDLTRERISNNYNNNTKVRRDDSKNESRNGNSDASTTTASRVERSCFFPFIVMHGLRFYSTHLEFLCKSAKSDVHSDDNNEENVNRIVRNDNNDSSSNNTNSDTNNINTQLSALYPVEQLIEMVTYLILLQQYTRVKTIDLFIVAQELTNLLQAYLHVFNKRKKEEELLEEEEHHEGRMKGNNTNTLVHNRKRHHNEIEESEKEEFNFEDKSTIVENDNWEDANMNTVDAEELLVLQRIKIALRCLHNRFLHPFNNAVNSENNKQRLEKKANAMSNTNQIDDLNLHLIPSSSELLLPLPHPQSIFTPSNLPIINKVHYHNATQYVTDQCRLLRADTFEATSRVMNAIYFTNSHHENSSFNDNKQQNKSMYLETNKELELQDHQNQSKEQEEYTASAETLSDVEHASIFHRVGFRGKVITSDQDYAQPMSYLLEVHPRSARANLRSGMRVGTTVCIVTSLANCSNNNKQLHNVYENAYNIEQTTSYPYSNYQDDDHVSEEMFWGVVSSSDANLLRANIVSITPCKESSSFELLIDRLNRNEKKGMQECSVLLETPVFMAGYAAIFSALRAFVGPLAMPLPMKTHLIETSPLPNSVNFNSDTFHNITNQSNTLSETSSSISTTTTTNHVTITQQSTYNYNIRSTLKPINIIPIHCLRAFGFITTQLRRQCTLDAGQDAVLRSLPFAEVLLVQGPPGTGKSFIGCRVVETHVRFKQMIETGDVLQKIDIEALSPQNTKFTASSNKNSCMNYSESSKMQSPSLLPVVGPVVVITYKNHALDEFLVDLLDSKLWEGERPRLGHFFANMSYSTSQHYEGHHQQQQQQQQQQYLQFLKLQQMQTKSKNDPFPSGCRLVRIGGRSREERLSAYNLSTLLHNKVDKFAINSLRERIAIMQQRLDRLTKEIRYLEEGKVPRVYFERWLTPEQRNYMSYDDRENWLSGKRFTGIVTTSSTLSNLQAVDKHLYLHLLRTRMTELLVRASAENINKENTSKDTTIKSENEEEDEDVAPSVFQEMKREDEHREYNNALSTSYLSAEAIALAHHPPSCPANIPNPLQSLWSLEPTLRHEYYVYFIQRTIALKARDCLTIMQAIEDSVRIRNHAMDEAKLELLRAADVVGLTTTGCAMNQNLLRSLRPTVLVVEEAAEVLESQLLACMTDSLTQIVLIGDHFQLQPKIDTFVYEKVNHMNTSLFERLASFSSLHEPIRLTEQRRMHPSLSKLIRFFYDPQPLLDHVSVIHRAFISLSGQRYIHSVPGLAERVFFWRHAYPEETAPRSRSKINTRELRMVQQVVQHLIHEGVAQHSLTVITPYLGQCRALRSVMRLSALAEVKVSTVDLFQGDENDIVILSLVRTSKLTEFIRMRNRLIVSCSRARFAFVMVGNDTLLMQCSHWASVLHQLHEMNCVGDKLPITRNINGCVQNDFLEVHDTASVSLLEKQTVAELSVGVSSSVELNTNSSNNDNNNISNVEEDDNNKEHLTSNEEERERILNVENH